MPSSVYSGSATVVLALCAGAATAASPTCPIEPPTIVLERFIPADCEACWRGTPPGGVPGPRTLLLDWIVPAGDGAPMASAALPDALDRAAGATLADTATSTRQRVHTLADSGTPRVGIMDGPAWNGYIALRVVVTRRGVPLPPGAMAFAALVERVPAGSEGTTVARQLVRAAVGPMPLTELARERRVQHLRAVRVPETDRPERLVSVAWIASADGRMIAAAQSVAPECRVR